MIREMYRTLTLTDRDGKPLTALLSLPGEELEGHSSALGFRDETVIQFFTGNQDFSLKLWMTCALKTLQKVSEDFSVNGPIIPKAEVTRLKRWVNAESEKATSYKTFKPKLFTSSRPSPLAARLA
jgi:hypothetical protein